MPLLPLYIPWEPGKQTDEWRQVRIPGGFECWRFKISGKNGVRVELDYSLGVDPSGLFRSRYYRWRRRPTRNRPPISTDEPSVGMVIWKNGRQPVRVRQRLKAGIFAAEAEGHAVRMGTSILSWGGGSSADMTIDLSLLRGSARFERGEDLPLIARPTNHHEMSPIPIARRRYLAMISLHSTQGTFDPVEFEGEAEYEHLVGPEMDLGLGELGWAQEAEFDGIQK